VEYGVKGPPLDSEGVADSADCEACTVAPTDPPWWTHNVFHARPAVDGQGVNLTPRIVERCVDACADEGTVQVDVVVTNVGPLPATDVRVRVYAGDIVVTEYTIDRVAAGSTSEGTVVTIPGARFDLGPVRIVVDPDGVVPECDEGDNELGVSDPRRRLAARRIERHPRAPDAERARVGPPRREASANAGCPARSATGPHRPGSGH
jgi:hypothetical protein